MSYKKLQQEDRRLRILETLNASDGYSINEHLLRDVLKAGHAHAMSEAALRSELAWLSDAGLVELKKIEEMYLPKLTPRGRDVAEGSASCPGVARPGP